MSTPAPADSANSSREDMAGYYTARASPAGLLAGASTPSGGGGVSPLIPLSGYHSARGSPRPGMISPRSGIKGAGASGSSTPATPMGYLNSSGVLTTGTGTSAGTGTGGGKEEDDFDPEYSADHLLPSNHESPHCLQN